MEMFGRDLRSQGWGCELSSLFKGKKSWIKGVRGLTNCLPEAFGGKSEFYGALEEATLEEDMIS